MYAKPGISPHLNQVYTCISYISHAPNHNSNMLMFRRYNVYHGH